MTASLDEGVPRGGAHMSNYMEHCSILRLFEDTFEMYTTVRSLSSPVIFVCDIETIPPAPFSHQIISIEGSFTARVVVGKIRRR